MVLPPLVGNYLKFCEYASQGGDGGLDLSGETFFFPTTLLPLVALVGRNNIALVPPSDPSVARYLETITNGSKFDEAKQFSKSYLPSVELPRQAEESNAILQRMCEMYDNGQNCGGENAFKYLVGEIVTNVYEHSDFSRALVMGQIYETKGFMDLCILDDGITIGGCFRKHGLVCESDWVAIGEAINGKSTKDITRGFGLNTTVTMFTHGAQAQMLVVSGKGAYHISSSDQQPYDIEKAYPLQGTLVSVRIPYPSPEVNIYEYL
jgi:hypothetical protein